MRGKPRLYGEKENKMGITPADAGKTTGTTGRGGTAQDHPRGCGENRFAYERKAKISGSPPRMRGKRCVRCFSIVSDRITPADAGKTYAGRYSTYRSQDHPRGCGENPTPDTQLEKLAGSPPRMRGKQCCGISFSNNMRITPADAGKTQAKSVQRRA